MIISKTVVASGILLAGNAVAYLRLPPFLPKQHESARISDGLQFQSFDFGDQRPLAGPKTATASSSADIPSFRAGQYTLTPQDDSTCATYGESQWTGTIDVTDSHRLFFWFFDSRNDPVNDPVIIWMNGGPGATSMFGLFNEMGACWLEPGANTTVPNDFAWNNNASVLFLDQPAGVGFSSRAEGSPIPSFDLAGASDFQAFLNIFFKDVFPDRARLPIHIAAESYGGHYGPVYLNHILESRRFNSRDAFPGNITSLILVNAVIDYTAPAVGTYEFLCKGFGKHDKIMNDTVCEVLALNVPKLFELGRNCDASNDGHECRGMMTYVEEMVHPYYYEQVMAGKRNPFNVHIPCPDWPLCSDITKGNMTAYLNQDHIKKALKLPSSFVFVADDIDVDMAYIYSKDPFRPTTREVARILDAYRTPNLGDIRVLVLQGNEDYRLNTPGNMWAYDNLRWSGLADYRLAPWRELPEGMAATGFWKSSGRLAFVAVDGAGHTVPGDVREGSYRIAQEWLEGGWRA
ncbi:carboxypeptidase Y [Trichoderma gamsii]|uniref:Carboxypeptidase n=1 Tax=Trichoderma gamsii TaxID=398673 RepID=A0A2P5A1T3_9HYPO|nr:carboxypeptidase Y [Trichoderma gamsii]PON30495.1 carboxypeptidase Y [Trichoderma gamsii]